MTASRPQQAEKKCTANAPQMRARELCQTTGAVVCTFVHCPIASSADSAATRPARASKLIVPSASLPRSQIPARQQRQARQRARQQARGTQLAAAAAAMSFPTPTAAPREAPGGVSLLFTPVPKAADGQKGTTPGDFRSFSGLGRTPASAGRGFGGGAGAGAGPTPPSRRRSLTPASSRQMDTPPPPPMDSLLDSPGGLGAGAAPWGQGPDGGERV